MPPFLLSVYRAYCDPVPAAPDAARYPGLASITSVTFRQALKGYNVNDVDRFLESLVGEVAALQAELEAAKKDVVDLRAQLP